MGKKDEPGSFIQLPYYVSDADESLILAAGVTVKRFLNLCVEDAVKHAKMNLGVE